MLSKASKRPGRAALVLCPHPQNGTCLYVSRVEKPEALGSFPGGMVDDGESMRDAAAREFYEEIGKDLKEISVEPIYVGPSEFVSDGVYTYLGALDVESWATLPSSFVGPERLIVRVAPMSQMTNANETPFVAYGAAFLKHIAGDDTLDAVFAKMGLSAALEAMRKLTDLNDR